LLRLIRFSSFASAEHGRKGFSLHIFFEKKLRVVTSFRTNSTFQVFSREKIFLQYVFVHGFVHGCLWMCSVCKTDYIKIEFHLNVFWLIS
jgi:hypothetical protein